MASPLLLSPIRLRGVTARNRIVVSPMCQYSSIDGGSTDHHLAHLGKFAMGGAGIVFSEETAVEARGRKSHHCAGIYKPQHVSQYRRINDFLRAHGAVPAIQLGHSGRRGSVHGPWDRYRPLDQVDAERGEPPWQTVSASAVPIKSDLPVPRALDRDEIAGIVSCWRDAAARALEAGYDIVEVHAAHGYLIHQFLSPVTNLRTDAYGGDLNGRMRFCLEVIEGVRSVCPAEIPVFLRVSAVDGAGWTIDDTVSLSREARDRGIDVVTTSSGGIETPGNAVTVARRPGYHVPYSEHVRRETGIKTIAVGLITEPTHAESILQRGEADLIALAREFLWNPSWPVHAAKELGAEGYFDLLPERDAWWLRHREKIRELARAEDSTTKRNK